jgi:hypothetical protein
VTLRKGWSWAGIAIALAVLPAVTGLSGCAPAAPAVAADGAGHFLTLAEAESSYGSYLAASDAAAAHGDEEQALSVASNAQWALLKSEYTALASAGTPVTRYRYGKPVFYVPALTAYPKWFVVSVPRRTDTGGHLGAAVSTLMLFERATPAKTWTLNGSAVLDQPLPALARNSDGYAIAVSHSDQDLLLPPDVVGASQAAVVDDGPGSPASAVVGGGPHTTGLYAAQAAQARADSARGLRYQWLMQGASYRQFQLRTAGGGALVLYGMYLNTTTEHPNLVEGSAIPALPRYAALFDAPGEVAYHALYVNWTYQYVAIDPPASAHDAKLEIIAAQGVPTFAHAY